MPAVDASDEAGFDELVEFALDGTRGEPHLSRDLTKKKRLAGMDQQPAENFTACAAEQDVRRPFWRSHLSNNCSRLRNDCP
jgi:hypothetical protein